MTKESCHSERSEESHRSGQTPRRNLAVLLGLLRHFVPRNDGQEVRSPEGRTTRPSTDKVWWRVGLPLVSCLPEVALLGHAGLARYKEEQQKLVMVALLTYLPGSKAYSGYPGLLIIVAHREVQVVLVWVCPINGSVNA